MKMQSKTLKVLCLFCAVLLLAFSFAPIFAASHDCHGEGCVVCAFCRTVKTAVLGLLIVSAFAALTQDCKKAETCSIFFAGEKTPVVLFDVIND